MVRKYPDVPVERLVTRDRPAHSLLAQAARAQLVVVGSRGHGAFAGLVLGSVSHAVLHRSPCPVAIVRPDAEEHHRESRKPLAVDPLIARQEPFRER